MANKRIIKGFSGTKEQWETLENVSEKMGLTNSELVHLCIAKVAEDDTMRAMLLSKFIEEKGKHIGRDRLLRIMSIKKDINKKRSASFNRQANQGKVSSQEEYTKEFIEEANRRGYTPEQFYRIIHTPMEY